MDGDEQMDVVRHDGNGMEFPSSVICCFLELIQKWDSQRLFQVDGITEHHSAGLDLYSALTGC